MSGVPDFLAPSHFGVYYRNLLKTADGAGWGSVLVHPLWGGERLLSYSRDVLDFEFDLWQSDPDCYHLYRWKSFHALSLSLYPCLVLARGRGLQTGFLG